MFTKVATKFNLYETVAIKKKYIYFFPEKFLSIRSGKIYKNLK